MNEATRRRVEHLENALRPDEQPKALTFTLSERSFQSTADLWAYSREQERLNRARGREAVDQIHLTVVRRCEPGEAPTERDLGPFLPGGVEP